MILQNSNSISRRVAYLLGARRTLATISTQDLTRKFTANWSLEWLQIYQLVLQTATSLRLYLQICKWMPRSKTDCRRCASCWKAISGDNFKAQKDKPHSFLNDFSLLRICGWLKLSSLDFSARHPIIWPHQHPVTREMIFIYFLLVNKTSVFLII